MRGEYELAKQGRLRNDGSSPRAWGIPQVGHVLPCVDRFIPTCVGNTKVHGLSIFVSSVHPHVRGEYLRLGGRRPDRPGSSPRAWGILLATVCAAGALRFIPTCVGNTTCSPAITPPPSVHPHVRGEYEPDIYVHRSISWFIPTCVGNTGQPGRFSFYSPVHPHVRGEYSIDSLNVIPNSGSSPRAWGIRAFCYSWYSPERFIPTCVGNTLILHFGQRTKKVHPHVRGEYTGHDAGQQRVLGSSPRAWGIQVGHTGAGASARFIPTCVGNTPHRGLPDSCHPVHPHVRGEYYMDKSGGNQSRGSSPRAWGIRCTGRQPAAVRRFIPTCVGNTS